MKPLWLENFQSQFSRGLRAEMPSVEGRFTQGEGLESLASELKVASRANESPADRLGVYNRQYWMRLFTVMQGELPLTARLLGFWDFNRVVQGFFIKAPPQHYDINQIALGFDTYAMSLPENISLREGQSAIDRALLTDAVAIDLAYGLLLRAPRYRPWALSQDEGSPMATIRLVPGYLRLDAPEVLMNLRLAIGNGSSRSDDEDLRFLNAAPGPRISWLMMSTETGLLTKPLNAWESRLADLLLRSSIGEALAILEQEARPEDKEKCASVVQAWFADGMRFGYWKATPVEDQAP